MVKNWRLYFLIILIFIISSGVIARLFILQILRHDFYSALAQNQHQILEELNPKRGEIFIQDKHSSVYVPLAVNRDFSMVYVVPKELDGVGEETKKEIAEQLASLLEMDQEEILSKLNKSGDPYEPIKNKIEDELAAKIKDLGLKGVYLSSQSWRWYPQNNFASHLLGFVGFNDYTKTGRYGLEGFYEEKLAGHSGFLQSQRDALGRQILTDFDIFEPAQNGDSLVLSIDQNIQYTAEEKLKELLEKWQAEAGTIIVTIPKTGAIKAMASLPNFNPNEYFKEKDIDVFLNPAIQKLFEPGSIFKPITMAAGLDSGKITPETTYFDEGYLQIGRYRITNAANKAYGWSNMTKVLEKSINTGAVFVQKSIGQETFKKYVQAFGFDRITEIDLEGEISGNISNLDNGREINYATASFGQGIAVTPLQIVTAIGAIANNGKMMKPFLVEKIIHPDGSEEIISPQCLGQPISSQTAAKLTDMLVSAVRQGYSKVKINDYSIAAKTGTAQIPNQGGYSNETIHSFIGFAPAYNPAFLIFIKIDKPKGVRFASDSLASAFAAMTQFLLNYYEIPPQ